MTAKINKRSLFEVVYEPVIMKLNEKECVNGDLISILESRRKRHRKDRLKSKAAMVHSMESSVNTKSNKLSPQIAVAENRDQSEISDSFEIPETANGEESSSSYEENKNWCIQKDSSHINQKNNKDNKAISLTQSEHEFACPTCFKKFDNRSNFIRHLLIHREEKLFPCTNRKKHHRKDRLAPESAVAHGMESKVNTGGNCSSLKIQEARNGEESEITNHFSNSKDEETRNVTWKKYKHRERKLFIGDRITLDEIQVAANGERSESSDEDNKNICIQKDSSHEKRKKHKHQKSNSGDSTLSHEVQVTVSGEQQESSNVKNKNVFTQKDSSHVKRIKHKQKASKGNIAGSVASHEMRVIVNEEESECNNEGNKKDCLHGKRKNHKKKASKDNTGDSMASHEIPVTESGEDRESINEENKNLFTLKDSSHVKQKKHKQKLSKDNIANSMASHEIPLIGHGKEPECNDEGNKNLFTQKDCLHEKRKKHKKKQSKENTGDSMTSHKVPVIESGEPPESSIDEDKNLFIQEDSSHVKQQKHKQKVSKDNIANSMASHDIPLIGHGEEPECNDEGNKSLFTQKDCLHEKRKKHKKKASKDNTGGSMTSHEIPVFESGERPETSNDEDKNLFIQEDSSHVKQKKHKQKVSKDNVANSMASDEIPLIGHGEEPECNDEGNKNLFTQKDRLHEKRKKHDKKASKENTGDSMTSHVIPVIESGEQPESSIDEDKNLFIQDDSSHVKQKKHEQKVSKDNIADSMASHEIAVIANREGLECNNEGNKNLFTQKDSLNERWKKHKWKACEESTVDSMASHEISMTASGEQPESNNEESRNVFTQKDRLRVKWKKYERKESKDGTVASMASHDIPIIASGEEPESNNEGNKNLFTQKDSLHERWKKVKWKECKDSIANSMASHEIPVTASAEQPEISNEENNTVCTQKDSTHQTSRKDKHKESKAVYLARLLQKSLFITQSKHEFACFICLKYFAYRSNFVRHLLVHRDKKDFTCDLCGKSFKLKQSLLLHMRTHMGEKPFECSECSKSFSDLNNLRRHILTHNNRKEFVCKICSKALTRKQHLAAHILRHQNVKQFPCPHCSKGFDYESRLRIHLKTCRKLNPIICQICSEEFPRVYNLKRHMRIHE